MLRELEDIAWRDLGRLEVGQAPSRARRVASVLNDARIRSCSRQVLNREMDMLHFLGSTSWHLDNTMNDMLRVGDEEGRPASPIRGPPSSVADNIRLAPVGLKSGGRNFTLLLSEVICCVPRVTLKVQMKAENTFAEVTFKLILLVYFCSKTIRSLFSN